MKFSEMVYKKPEIEELSASLSALLSEFEGAESAGEQIEIIEKAYKVQGTFSTMAALTYIRHTIDTADKFYDEQNNYIDEISPLVEELTQKFSRAMLASRFRAELEGHFGELLFTNLEISVRTFKSDMIELMQQENALASEYQKLYAGAIVEFDGKRLTLSELGPYKGDTDRAVRRAAYAAEGAFFDDNREELDRLFTELIKNRTAQAKLLGHENYLQLGYDRLGRNCYGIEQVEEFRAQIAKELVPIVFGVKAIQARRLGLRELKIYDDGALFPDGNPKPKGTAEDILEAGREMYHALSPETSEFIDFMYDGELLDVLSKPGKAPGGYCTTIYDYKAPFIFSNFNATSGDVDVLTHEAGHAFADYRSMKHGYIEPLQNPTIEACECHSMSMEFLTGQYHRGFFGEDAAKYELSHCEDALSIISYIALVDEFQHKVYENPDMTAQGRNEIWLSLEAKYRPWIKHDNLPFYARGASWQRQLHIYLYPLYYIDYAMAQTVAFQFWMAFLESPKEAWGRYLSFVDAGGTKTFEALVKDAGLKIPYEPGCIKAVAEGVFAWISDNQI